MMSKAAFLMQEQLRRNYVMITDTYMPNTFLARGRLQFPQGLTAIATLFHDKKPADVYAHPYFMEKQSDPSQPSPQLHLTEESQGIMKVMSGLRYMRDENSKLDNTMVVVTDYEVEVSGRMLIVPEDGESAPFVSAVRSSQQAKRAPDASHGSLTLQQRALLRRPTSHQLTTAPGGGGGIGNGGAIGSQSQNQPSGGPGQRRDDERDNRTDLASVGYTTFPSPEGCASDPLTSYRYFKASLFGRRALRREEEESGSGAVNIPSLFERCTGGYSVIYNPIELNEKTMVELLMKLKREERVVQAIVSPTRQSWRHLQVWADAFPDAELYSSGEIPILSAPHTMSEKSLGDSGPGTPVSVTARRGGCQDMGNGLTGLSFPEVDLEAERLKEQEALSDSTKGKSRAQAQPHAEGKTLPLGGTRGKGGKEAEEEEDTQGSPFDPADVLWSGCSLFIESAEHEIGLRSEDAHRVRVLAPPPLPSDIKSEAGSLPPPHCVKLTSNIELLHIPGDTTTDEYVLYDATSATLACTDLFHGEYADLDPVNSWVCRVWFKFMKQGNHKRVDIVPRFKWLQVMQRGTLNEILAAIEYVTRTRPIQSLLFAHGTPPMVVEPANVLRRQWGLPPLHDVELPHRSQE